MGTTNINIKNRKAKFEFFILAEYTAGIVLTGTEIKSVKAGKASIGESYCHFQKDELWIKNLHIAEYKFGSVNNHEPKRPRKLLLKRQELNKLQNKVKEKGLTIIALEMLVTERGFAKIKIALAKGKKNFDKRHSIKDKDQKRELDRDSKYY
ncbi:UNVERIFIED_CONTAM: hypothetical protein GTU68_022647 [Idotea baltica]|nr:hypothetical protein [Idotea baltica]